MVAPHTRRPMGAYGCRREDPAIPITGVHLKLQSGGRCFRDSEKHDLPAFAPARTGQSARSAAQTLTTVE